MMKRRTSVSMKLLLQVVMTTFLLYDHTVTSFSVISSSLSSSSSKQQQQKQQQQQQVPWRLRATLDDFNFNSESIPASAPAQAAFESIISHNPDAMLAVDELLSNIVESPQKNDNDNNSKSSSSSNSNEKSLALLFVGQYYADYFNDIVKNVSERLNNKETTEVVAIISSGGVVGGGNEIDNNKIPAIVLLYGTLPPKSNVCTFSFTDDTLPTKQSWNELANELQKNSNQNTNIRPPSFLVFSDPYSPVEQVLQGLERSCGSEGSSSTSTSSVVIAGGIAVPEDKSNNQKKKKTEKAKSGGGVVAMNGNVLDRGSVLVVALSGNIGLQTIVSQGCRPIGPTFRVTKTYGNILMEIDGKPAIQQIEEQVMSMVDDEAKAIIQNGWLVGGVCPTTEQQQNDQQKQEQQQEEQEVDNDDDYDFLVRQIVGYQPRSGSIVIGGGLMQKGDIFQFHVRAKHAAKEDMKVMMDRAKTERLFAVGTNHAADLLAAIQISCISRGSELFETKNADLNQVTKLFDTTKKPNPKPTSNTKTTKSSSPSSSSIQSDTNTNIAPVAGFFANGEIGPVGTRIGGFSSDTTTTTSTTSSSSIPSSTTHMHGFTTVVALLCDYSTTTTSSTSTTDSSTGSSTWG